MGGCDTSYCSKCKGIQKAVFGALLLLNAFIWPQWLGVDGWLTFLGLVLLLGGIVRVAKPMCGCCDSCEAPKKKR